MRVLICKGGKVQQYTDFEIQNHVKREKKEKLFVFFQKVRAGIIVEFPAQPFENLYIKRKSDIIPN